MSSRHQPENGADSERFCITCGKLHPWTAETATVSDDRLSSAGVAPDGVAQQTVSQTTSAGGTSADNEPATNAGRAILAASICKCGVAKSYHPRPGHDYEPRYNVDAAMIVRVEREAAERAATAPALPAGSGGLDVERLRLAYCQAKHGGEHAHCDSWIVTGIVDWYARLATPQPGEPTGPRRHDKPQDGSADR